MLKGPPYLIGQYEMDVKVLIENGTGYPVFFRTREDLDAWSSQVNASVDPVGNRKVSSVVCINRNEHPVFHLLFVRASYYGYRSALIEYAKGKNLISEEDQNLMEHVHADHVFNRAAIQKPNESWVALFPLDRNVNMKFGAQMEIGARENIDKSVEFLDDFRSLKILTGWAPEGLDQIDEVVSDLDRRLLEWIPGSNFKKEQYLQALRSSLERKLQK